MKTFLAATVLLSLVVTSTAQVNRSASSPDAEKELRRLVVTWNDAEIKNDVATIDRLLAPEFSFLGGSNRKEYLEKVVPDKTVNYTGTIENVNVELYGTTAIVTSLEAVKGNTTEKSVEGKLLIMTVWLNRSAGWQCVKASVHVVNAVVH
jgi:hypothetical protein